MRSAISRRTALVGAAAQAATLTVPSIAAATTTNHFIRITGFAFVPARIVVRPGDSIRWVNDDLAPHTATATEFGWDTGELAQGESAEIAVTEGMETTYFCVFHPHMKGEFVLA